MAHFYLDLMSDEFVQFFTFRGAALYCVPESGDIPQSGASIFIHQYQTAVRRFARVGGCVLRALRLGSAQARICA